jgi:hypothetical protein
MFEDWPLLRPSRRGLTAAGAVVAAGILVLFVAGMAGRLSQGPVSVDGLRPGIERLLATAVKGGHARIGHASLVWFDTSGSLGLRLSDVELKDGQGRSVLRAREAEAGLALGSLWLLKPGPGRLAATDFFAAVSVSSKGKYALGYDAVGAPAAHGSLWRYVDDLTGRARLSRPLSFLREVELSRGVVALKQAGGPADWRGQLRAVRFRKQRGRLDALVDLTAGDAIVIAAARGGQGLKDAVLRASVSNLFPARIFPSAGVTHRLSGLDAPVTGRGFLSWSRANGVRAADIDLAAGEGFVRTRQGLERFTSGALRAVYDPSGRRVLIKTARADWTRAQIDVRGQAWIVPEGRSRPARVEAALASVGARIALAPGVEPERVDSLTVRGRYIPADRRVEIDTARIALPGGILAATGVLTRPRANRSWGIALNGRFEGAISPTQMVAIWPDGLDDGTRAWIRGHVLGGSVGEATCVVRIPEGGLAPHRPLARSWLRLAFAFQDGEVLIDPSMPKLQAASGTGLLQGDRFDLALRSGDMSQVTLSDGAFRLPKLVGEGRRMQIEGRVRGDARNILQVVDRSAGHIASGHGLAPERLSGRADLRISIGRPMGEAALKDYDVAYQGVVSRARLDGAVLGLTLASPAMTIDGSLDRLAADGEARLGPFRGPMQYVSSFPEKGAGSQKIELNGVLDASVAGVSGPAGSTLPFTAKFQSGGNSGHGTIRSRAFDGQVTWTANRGGRFLLAGTTDAAALRSVGAPVGKGVPRRLPAKLLLTHTGSGWAGKLTADAYSGEVTLTTGPDARFRYAADLTLAEAHKIGLDSVVSPGKPTPLTLDVSTSGGSGQAAYAAGAVGGQVSWAPAGARTQFRWRAMLRPEDLRALGLPSAVTPSGPVPIDAVITPARGSFNGTVRLDGGVFRIVAATPTRAGRKVKLTGSMDGTSVADLGIAPPGMIVGQAGLTADLDIGKQGVRAARLDVDLTGAAVRPPFVAWSKPAGQPLRFHADLTRGDDGLLQANAVQGEGQGVTLAATGQWKPNGEGVLRATSAKLGEAFDGAFELTTGDAMRLVVRARYFDARKLLERSGPTTASKGSPGARAVQPLHIDAQVAQARVSDEGVMKNVSITGDWGPDGGRADVNVARADGVALMNVQFRPVSDGTSIKGQISDVADIARQMFGLTSFKGGQASFTGRLADGGADLKLEMTKVRLVSTPGLASILTVGSLTGMADMLNGDGIEFTQVVAPVLIRGSRIMIGRARATGPAMGITTQGTIDLDSRTVDLAGGIAPSYALNSAMGAVPLLGELLISHKGEGMFGLTYSAKGDFATPKVNVNPFSLATPGILRRIFEGRSAYARTMADEGG